MRWSELMTLDFVKMYGKHECLWNPNHPGYKVKREREKAYESISADFQKSHDKLLTIHEVKVKVKNLRTTYMQQVNKILEKSTPDYIYEPSLIWFTEMDKYLKHVSTIRHTSQYSVLQASKEVDSTTQAWLDSISTEDPHPDPLMVTSEDENESVKQEPEMTVKECIKPLQAKIKKRKFKFRNKISSIHNEKATEETNKDSSVSEDEFDIYGKYIASQLRKMDLQKALRLQLTIQNLVSEARISDIINKKR